jgi:hypothetical protein
MTDRITDKHLKSLVDYINTITDSPKESYKLGQDGRYHAQIGCYCLDYAYSGVQLQRICNDGGGVSQPIGGGYGTKRELYEKLQAYIRGIQDGKELYK